jgi:NADH:ubiquinone oxidoreductase subunit E
MFFHTFKDREWHYDLIEDLTGARLTTSYTRVGGVAYDATPAWLARLREFVNAMPDRIDDYEALLTKNSIWLKRTQNVGRLTAAEALSFGVTGPVLRASGVAYDIRKAKPYSGYQNYDFEIPVGTQGDVYDRYLVRMEEMRQSVRILDQALKAIPDGPVNVDDPKIFLPPKQKVLTSMEELIHQFMIVTEGFECPPGENLPGYRSPQGRAGVLHRLGGRQIALPVPIRLLRVQQSRQPGPPGRRRARGRRGRLHRQHRPGHGRGRSLMYGPEFERRVDALVAKYPQPKAALLPVLWEVQLAKGYVPLEAEDWVGKRPRCLRRARARLRDLLHDVQAEAVGPEPHPGVHDAVVHAAGSDELVRHLETKLASRPGRRRGTGSFRSSRWNAWDRAARRRCSS